MAPVLSVPVTLLTENTILQGSESVVIDANGSCDMAFEVLVYGAPIMVIRIEPIAQDLSHVSRPYTSFVISVPSAVVVVHCKVKAGQKSVTHTATIGFKRRQNVKHIRSVEQKLEWHKTFPENVTQSGRDGA